MFMKIQLTGQKAYNIASNWWEYGAGRLIMTLKVRI